MKHSIIEAINKLIPVLHDWEREEIINGNYEVITKQTSSGEVFTFVLKTQMAA